MCAEPSLLRSSSRTVPHGQLNTLDSGIEPSYVREFVNCLVKREDSNSGEAS